MHMPSVRSLLDFSGKTVLVTGAGGGIGAGIAARFAEAGACVAAHYRSSKESAEKVVKIIEKAGGTAALYQADLAKEDEVQALMGAVQDRFGSLDIVINNAGSFPVSPIANMSHSDWKTMFSSNTESVFLCTREAAARMETGGTVINIASIAATNPGPAHAHYNSAKAAVVMFTQSAAQEFAPKGIRVNAVSPGVISSDTIREAWPEGVKRWETKVPLGRMGTPTDVADACLFLASPGASFITGANLPVEGGILSSPIY